MNLEDRAELTKRLNQEELLISHNFKPVPKNGSELWISYLPGGVAELWTRAQAWDRIEELQREGQHDRS